MLLKEFCSHANWIAIIVAALAYYGLGAIFYSFLFRKAWMEGHKIKLPETAEEKAAMRKGMPGIMVMTLLMGIVMAIVIGIFAMALESVKCMAGIKLGLALSAVAIIPMVMSHMYLQKPAKIWLIDALYHITGIVLMSIIISVWH